MNWNWPRTAALAFSCMLAPGCGGDDAPPLRRPIERHVVSPACADMAVSSSYDERTGDVHYEPACYPAYFFGNQQEGYFLASTHQPLPVLEKTCGAFRILVAFMDTPAHRDALRQNSFILPPIKSHLEIDLRSGLVSLFAGYGPRQVFGHLGLPALPPVTFTYDVKLVSASTPEAPSAEDLADFATYDAVVLLGSLPGGASGSGVGKFPNTGPVFRTDEPSVLRIDPLWLSPGLFYNELFRRNVPGYLSQYRLGPTALVEENGIRYARMLVVNPRTLQRVSPEDTRFLSSVLNGWHDVDQDGITDCNDTELEARPWNVDADLIPDHLDPDLDADNGTYFWTRG